MTPDSVTRASALVDEWYAQECASRAYWTRQLDFPRAANARAER